MLGLGGVAAPLLPAWGRALLAAIALFWIPGYLVATATGIRDQLAAAERPALYFVASVAVALPSFAIVAVAGTSLAAFRPAFAVTLIALAVLAVRASRRAPQPHGPAQPHGQDRSHLPLHSTKWPTAPLPAIVLLMVALTTVGAWLLTATGSVDRWWYLAYVRHYLDAAAIGFAEPLLGSGFVHPRFTFNAWLFELAAWAGLAGVDPVWLYERACAPLLVPAAFSATFMLARSLFSSTRTAWSAALAAGLLWTSGTLFPALARMPEDKLLALLVVAPVTTAAIIRLLCGASSHAAFRDSSPDPPPGSPGSSWLGRRRWLVVAAAAVAVQATTHALVYVIVLAVIVPFVLLMAARRHAGPAVAAAVLVLLAAGSAYPLLAGTSARAALRADGAGHLRSDHPVARVHRGRDRLIALGDDTDTHAYVVNPRLLLHPLLIIALAALPLLALRPERERLFLLPATAIPLVFAFVPPLTVALGALVSPWMVYRVLWAIPFSLLLAVALDEAGRRLPRLPWLPTAVVVLLALPGTAHVLAARTRPERARLATPRSGPVTAVVDAVRALPDGAVVATAAELGERLPALTGKRVLAMTDRATVVFAGDRAAGESRLRARAAIFAGTWQRTADAPTPTHVAFERPSAAEQYCGELLLEAAPIGLCTFIAQPALQPLPATDAGDREGRLALHCEPPPVITPAVRQWPRPGPWSARFVTATCRLRPRESADRAERFGALTLSVEALTGMAAEELIVVATGEVGDRTSWRVHDRLRLTPAPADHDGPVRRATLALPAGAVDAVTVTITPTFLPFLKLADLQLTTEPVSLR